MPFLSYTTDDRPAIRLRQCDDSRFQLLTSFRYRDDSVSPAKPYVVHEHDEDLPPDGGNGTDLASIPPWLWGLVASYGRQTLPALLHDSLCVEARNMDDPAEGLKCRAEADRVFRVALGEEGVGPWRRGEMWAAVSIFRYQDFVPRRFRLMFAYLVVYLVAFVVGCCLGWLGALVALVAPAITAWFWGADAPVMLIAVYASLLIAPALLLNLLVGTFLDPVDAVRQLRRGQLPKPTIFRLA